MTVKDVDNHKTELIVDECDEGKLFGLGRLQFGVAYDFTKTSLTVKVHEAKKLVAKDANGTSDPYVKVIVRKFVL